MTLTLKKIRFKLFIKGIEYSRIHKIVYSILKIRKLLPFLIQRRMKLKL